jgi:hypothetical protein
VNRKCVFKEIYTEIGLFKEKRKNVLENLDESEKIFVILDICLTANIFHYKKQVRKQ